MARLPYVDPANAPGPVKDALALVPPLHIFRMMANADSAFPPWMRWALTLLRDLQLDPLLRELAILRVAHLTPHAEYEWVQHMTIAESAGATEEQIAALERDDPPTDCFSGPERAVLRFTTEVVRDARASEETIRALEQTMSPREIVELLMVIGQYMMLARVMATTRIDLDKPAGASALGAAT